MSSFIQQIFAIKSQSRWKMNKCKTFLPPNFLGRDDPNFSMAGVSVTYHPPFAKVWLSSVCWSPSAKPGNKVECWIYRGWVKTRFQFQAVCGPKFMSFWDDAGDPLQFATHLHAYVYRVSLQRYRPLKLRLSCKILEKWFLGARYVGEEVPQILDACSNCTYFWPCGRLSLSSVQRALQVTDQRKKKENKKSVVRYRYTDNYVRRPNK